MSAIYIHIPFCKKACNYCDFHFSVSTRNKTQVVNSICIEAEKQKEYLKETIIDTIYFGGGTPSILSKSEISDILSAIHKFYTISNSLELTLEANPDDLSKDYIKNLNSLGINRLSIGVQSFFDADLMWMNRRHNAKEAIDSIKMCQDMGFSNVNIDLIYGLPCSSLQSWEQNLNILYSLQIPHFSAYHLSFEPKSILGVWKNKGKVQEIPEEDSIKQYELLLNLSESWNYLNYEISNFCLEDHYSRHNLNYWNQGLYLGLGPSAHSFNGTSRQWNVSVNQQYINKIITNEVWFEKEELSIIDKYNDYILTRLRTMWGIDFNEINDLFGELFSKYSVNEHKQFIDNGLLKLRGTNVYLTNKGKFVANMVISGLMYVD